jgi:hypothetical protein
MSALRISSLAAGLALLAINAAAQTPAGPDQPQLISGTEAGGAVQPVMDQEILAHFIFSQLEGRFGGSPLRARVSSLIPPDGLELLSLIPGAMHAADGVM